MQSGAQKRLEPWKEKGLCPERHAQSHGPGTDPPSALLSMRRGQRGQGCLGAWRACSPAVQAPHLQEDGTPFGPAGFADSPQQAPRNFHANPQRKGNGVSEQGNRKTGALRMKVPQMGRTQAAPRSLRAS